MKVFDLFHEVGVDMAVVIKDECEKELYCGKFGNVSMRYAGFKIYKVIEEDGIMIIYI